MLIKSLGAMFGFMFTQRISTTLRQMKVIYIIALYVTYGWADAVIIKIISLEVLQENQYTMLGLYIGLYGTLLAAFWGAIKDMRKPHE